MVDLSLPSVLIFIVILIAVPIQFFLSPSSSSDARYHLHTFKNSLSQFLRSLSKRFSSDPEDIVDAEATPTETEHKYFASSLEPRDPRPPFIKYRVGDVVRHKVHGYRGVIIGWDAKAVAPLSWIQRTHKGRKDWADLPNYSIIIDTRDRLTPQLAYVVEENIEVIEGTIFHPLVKNYFESYNGKQYIPRPWHRKIYPNG